MKLKKVSDHIGSKKRYLVRIYNCHLLSPAEDSKHYSALLSFSRKDTPVCDVIKGATGNVYIENQGYFTGRDGIALSFDCIKNPIRSGDKNLALNSKLAGELFIKSNSTNKPYIYKVVDGKKVEITDEVPDGCYVRATLDFYPYNFNGSAGVGCSITKLRVLDDPCEEDEEDE